MLGSKKKKIKLLESELGFITSENQYLRMRLAELPELLDEIENRSDSEEWKNAISECRRALL